MACAFRITRAFWSPGCATRPIRNTNFGSKTDEDYVRELIDRIDAMSVRGAKLCGRCTEQHPGKWQAKSGKAQCSECERTVDRYFVLEKATAVARRTSRGVEYRGSI